MNVLIVGLIFCIAVLWLGASGVLEKEKKYVYVSDSAKYIAFETKDHNVFFHSNSTDIPNYKGTYVETDTDYTVFLDGSVLSSLGTVYTKLANDSIAEASDHSQLFVRQRGSFIQRLGF